MSVSNAKTMPFGKHKGLPVTEVSSSYLKWCYESFPECPDFIVDELSRRGVETGQGWMKERAVTAAATPKHKSTTVGRDYDRLHKEFLQAGGDAGQCPFDTNDHQYEGPEICWTGDLSTITSSASRRKA